MSTPLIRAVDNTRFGNSSPAHQAFPTAIRRTDVGGLQAIICRVLATDSNGSDDYLSLVKHDAALSASACARWLALGSRTLIAPTLQGRCPRNETTRSPCVTWSWPSLSVSTRQARRIAAIGLPSDTRHSSLSPNTLSAPRQIRPGSSSRLPVREILKATRFPSSANSA